MVGCNILLRSFVGASDVTYGSVELQSREVDRVFSNADYIRVIIRAGSNFYGRWIHGNSNFFMIVYLIVSRLVEKKVFRW